MNDKQLMDQWQAKNDIKSAVHKMLETSEAEFKIFLDRMDKACTDNPLWLGLKKELENGRQLLKHQKQLDQALKNALTGMITLVK